MKRNLIKTALIPLLLGAVACTGVKKTDSSQQREEWLDSLNDSIAYYKGKVDSTTLALSEIREEIAGMMPRFEHVQKPREVEGYYVMKGWSSRFPLTSTSMAARISESEGFELLAALSGGVFNQISVSAGGESVKSAVVPHDQAMNYRAGNLNTVCFTGSQADSVGRFISSHTGESVSVSFLGGARTVSLRLPTDAAEMISATWNLYSSQREMHWLEKTLPLLSRKVDLCRRMLNERDSVAKI